VSNPGTMPRASDDAASRTTTATISRPVRVAPEASDHFERADAQRRRALGARSDAARVALITRQKERYGGLKVGSAFFGWVTATGTAAVLIALASLAGAAAGLFDPPAPGTVPRHEVITATRVLEAAVIAVVLFIAFLGGGYVAGRMARFSGALQGFGVWLWAVAVSVALVVMIGGGRLNVPTVAAAGPGVAGADAGLTVSVVVAVVIIAAVSLAGAVCGGRFGMRFHRRVDRAFCAR
jgi:hypothetical protein